MVTADQVDDNTYKSKYWNT